MEKKVFSKEDEAVLKKYRKPPRCVFCGRYKGKPFKDHLVCEECLRYIREYPDACDKE